MRGPRPPPRRGPRHDAGRRRRRGLGLLVLLLLLLALWSQCRCGEPEEDAPAPIGEAEIAEPAAPLPPRPEPPKPRLDRLDRPALPAPPPRSPDWLQAFHEQVAARAPRLAACFVGTEQPGALRWSTSVDRASGRVSEHRLQPTLQGASLSEEQESCVLQVLGEPAYKLPSEPGQLLPERVALVIEF